MRIRILLTISALVIAAALCMGPGRCGGAYFSDKPAPDVAGTWNVTYDDTISVEVRIGGAVYTGTITGSTGSVGFTHDGTPVDLPINCDWPGVLCPSEVFPSQVTLEQRNFESYPHQVHMTINETECTGTMRLPVEADGECGGDTGVDCTEQICDGTVDESTVAALGAISEPSPEPLPGSTPDYSILMVLDGGLAMPTANCLLGFGSLAEADIQYTGTYDPETNAMRATDLTNGVITVIYAGGCFWAAEDQSTYGLALLGAEIILRTGFTATKQGW